MKKSNMNVLVLAIAAAAMMSLTACGAKKEAAAPTETVAETVAETAAETEAEATTEAVESEADSVEVGALDADGKFTAADGSYEIVVPKGWTVSADSTPDVVVLVAENEKDIIEITALTGEDAAGSLKAFPETAEEYNTTVLKDAPASEITKYSIVKDDEEGVETFQVYCKYDESSALPYAFTAMSGLQDQADKVYCVANALIQSEGMEDTITKTIDSFQYLK